MKVVIIHGQSHEGTTCRIARLLANKLGGKKTEFFLPRDFGEICGGCGACIIKSEKICPHYDSFMKITKAMDEADVIILASPVYCYHVTGAMKVFLDHYAYRWMVHRPEGKMFRKQAVCISTAAGAGMKSAIKDMKDSTFFWGCARTYELGIAVRANSWDEANPNLKEKTERKIASISAKITKRCGKITSSVKTRFMFSIMRMMQKNGWNEADKTYWQEKGWLGSDRPWKT